MQTRIIFGAPGTGKTTELLNIMQTELRTIKPHELAFTSFTRKAVHEARGRIQEQFNLTADDLPYVSTIHSLCYKALHLTHNMVMGDDHYQQLGDLLGVQFTPKYQRQSYIAEGPTKGDKLLFLDGLSRVCQTSLMDIWSTHDFENLSWHELVQISNTLRAYKRDLGILDFTDMLMHYCGNGIPAPVKVAIIDEAQDLSMLQWQVLNIAFANAERRYIAGDDDQTIYGWSGANVRNFLSLPGQKHVLKKTHRLPKAIFTFSQYLVRQITHRQPKHIEPQHERGALRFHNFLDHVDIGTGSVFMLARTRRQLHQFTNWCFTLGLPFTTAEGPSITSHLINTILAYERARAGANLSLDEARAISFYTRTQLPDHDWFVFDDLDVPNAIWHETFTHLAMEEREYILACLKQGENIKHPRIHIGTIHSTKGGEADQVILKTDITKKIARRMVYEPDNEHRVFYVGTTRAKHQLDVVMPQTRFGYTI